MPSVTATIEACKLKQMQKPRLLEPQVKGPLLETIDLIPIDPVGSVVNGPSRDEVTEPRRWSVTAKLFLGLVGIPTFTVAIYFLLIAAPRYVSEASFIVRSANFQGAVASGGATGAASLSASRGQGDLADAVNSYVLSRDMVEKLDSEGELRKMFSRQESDFIFRFPNLYSRDDREQLFYHYLSMVRADLDKTSGIISVSAQTFRAEDSQKLVNLLLQHAEELINRLNERMVKDGESYAQSVVERAQNHVLEVGMRLDQFRNSVGSVDPSRESATALDQIAKMSTEVAEMRASLQQQMSLAPASPAIPSLRERIRTYQDQIERERSKIVGVDKSLAVKLSEFESLTLERQLAAREIDSALSSLAAARQEAQRQHLYLQRITGPNLPDEAKYPKRALGVVLALALFLIIFLVVNSIYKGIVEQQE